MSHRRPDSSFLWLRAPLRALRYAVWQRHRCRITVTMALLLLLLLLLNFIYSAPVSTEDPQTPSPAAHRALLSPPTPLCLPAGLHSHEAGEPAAGAAPLWRWEQTLSSPSARGGTRSTEGMPCSHITSLIKSEVRRAKQRAL